MKTAPLMKSLRHDPRYAAFLRKLNPAELRFVLREPLSFSVSPERFRCNLRPSRISRSEGHSGSRAIAMDVRVIGAVLIRKKLASPKRQRLNSPIFHHCPDPARVGMTKAIWIQYLTLDRRLLRMHVITIHAGVLGWSTITGTAAAVGRYPGVPVR
jgi:hypothetical protein